jgi:secreted trypsin-like serine protease
MRRFTLLLCVLALAVAGPAAAVIGGSPDPDHSYVGIAFDGSTACSGVLVAPRVFLTAAHCFANGSSILVGFGPRPRNLATTGVHGTVTNDPQFCGGCTNGTNGVEVHDLAVVILATAQPGPYASLPSVNLADSLPKHAQVTIVGYGIQGYTGNGKKATPVDLLERYRGDAELATTGGKIADAFIKLSGSGGNATPCFGDSGGPDLLAGTNTVIGLTSWGKGSTCGSASFSYRLDTQASLDFIHGVTAAAHV